jgi:hypothetical protein
MDEKVEDLLRHINVQDFQSFDHLLKRDYSLMLNICLNKGFLDPKEVLQIYLESPDTFLNLQLLLLAKFILTQHFNNRVILHIPVDVHRRRRRTHPDGVLVTHCVLILTQQRVVALLTTDGGEQVCLHLWLVNDRRKQ